MLLSPLIAAALFQEHFWENKDRDITMPATTAFAGLKFAYFCFTELPAGKAGCWNDWKLLLSAFIGEKKKALWFIVLTLHSSDSWAWWQKAKHTKETTVKLSWATRSRQKVSEVITYCACLPCNKWQLLRAAICTTSPLEGLQLSAAPWGKQGHSISSHGPSQKAFGCRPRNVVAH